MKKSDLLKILEEHPDDMEIVFYDAEWGDYIEDFKAGRVTLGRFKWKDNRRGEFYSASNNTHWNSWKHLGDVQVLVLEGD